MVGVALPTQERFASGTYNKNTNEYVQKGRLLIQILILPKLQLQCTFVYALRLYPLPAVSFQLGAVDLFRFYHN